MTTSGNQARWFFAAESEDDGFWYVYADDQWVRAPANRQPLLVMITSEHTDGGKERAFAIAQFLTDSIPKETKQSNGKTIT